MGQAALRRDFDSRAWAIHREADRVEARFEGFLGPADGALSATEFLAQTSDATPIHLIFDVGQMEGYANEARAAWTTAMRKRRQAIRSLTTRGAKPIIRLGASLLGMVAGIQVTHM